MRRTPPLVIVVQPQPAVQAVAGLIAALAAAGWSAWLVGFEPRAWPVWLAVPLAAAWAWREATVLPRRLRWDGQAWWLAEPGRDDEAAARLQVLIDLDHWLLLRASAGPCWLPLSRRQQGASWGALRATLWAAPDGVEP